MEFYVQESSSVRPERLIFLGLGMEGGLSSLLTGSPPTIRMSVIMGGLFKDLPNTIRGEDLWISYLIGCSGTGGHQTYSTWQEEKKGSRGI